MLNAGQIQLARHEGSFEIRYFDHVLPVAPRSLSEVLGEAAREAKSDFLAFSGGCAREFARGDGDGSRKAASAQSG